MNLAAKAITPDTAEPLVRARNVHKSFGDNEVLKGIDLDVQAGEVVVILGPSGSGKSTFLRCINHLEAINRGSSRWITSRSATSFGTDGCTSCRSGPSSRSVARSAWCSSSSTFIRT